MLTTQIESLRRQLEDREERLRVAVSQGTPEQWLLELLERVEDALARLNTSRYARCLVCEDEIGETERLSNPLLEYCLCDLTPQRQRALEHDLNLARRLQNGLLPDPDLGVPGWTTHYIYEPAGVVSGDYCDLWVRAEDPSTLHFAVADVSGKGVAASLLMAHIQAALRSLVGAGVPLAGLIDRVNSQLLEANLSTHYATLAFGRAEADGTIELVNAGHCSPLVLRKGEIERLDPTGLPIGLFEGRPYAIKRFRLEPGDGLLLHTDGVTEAQNGSGEMFGVERLETLLSIQPTQNARQLIDSVYGELRAFVDGREPTDDLTALTLVRSA